MIKVNKSDRRIFSQMMEDRLNIKFFYLISVYISTKETAGVVI